MFTGIVDHCGIITAIKKDSVSCQLWVESQFNDVVKGESIAVDGICLTACDPAQGKFRFDLSYETCQCTIASFYKEGSHVNLERALLLSDRISGHVVTGHVDQVMSVKSILPMKEFQIITFEGINAKNKRFIIPKGSITLNGVSLTINAFSDQTVEVALIPHTLERTNLQFLKPNDKVNVEFDVLAKMVARQYEVAYEK